LDRAIITMVLISSLLIATLPIPEFQRASRQSLSLSFDSAQDDSRRARRDKLARCRPLTAVSFLPFSICRLLLMLPATRHPPPATCYPPPACHFLFDRNALIFVTLSSLSKSAYSSLSAESSATLPSALL